MSKQLKNQYKKYKLDLAYISRRSKKVKKMSTEQTETHPIFSANFLLIYKYQ